MSSKKDIIIPLTDIAAERAVKSVTKKVARKNVTMTLEEANYQEFQKICKEEGFVISGVMDLMVRSFVETYRNMNDKSEF